MAGANKSNSAKFKKREAQVNEKLRIAAALKKARGPRFAA
jgi:hypothetical protein